MNLIFLTAGAGAYFCGSCMRDNTLARALLAAGHKPLLVPLYSPLKTDEPDVSVDRRFYGGLNVYLQQKSWLFRHTPWLFDRLLDATWLLNGLMKFAGKTDPRVLGALTHSMLRGEDGLQRKELDKLLAWLRTLDAPDAVVLSNALFVGFARRIKQELKVPVLCTLQGEDYFLDSLPEPWNEKSWAEMRARAADIDAFLPVSRFYGEQMARRLDLPADKIHVVLNGIDVSDIGEVDVTDTRAPTVGFLARFAPEKGLRELLRAFKVLCERGRVPDARLRAAGCTAPQDLAYKDAVLAEIRSLGLEERVEIVDCPDKPAKIAFLKSLRVLSVPATYGESFGLYVIEALACGTPVVQPDHAAFPEILEATGGGLLVSPGDAEALAAGLERALTSDDEHARWRRQGREAVLASFTAARMARDVAAVCERVIGAARAR